MVGRLCMCKAALLQFSGGLLVVVVVGLGHVGLELGTSVVWMKFDVFLWYIGDEEHDGI